MSARSIILGLLLGLSLSAVTYYNDFVIGQTSLLGHLLPIGVIGFVLFLLLAINPLLHRVRRGWTLRAAEVGVITAIGLTACAWPDAGFFRTALTNLVMPAVQYPVNASWSGKELMAYVPGASVRLGQGHVTDWPTVADWVVSGQTAPPQSAARTVWEALPERSRRPFVALAEGAGADTEAMRAALNRFIDDGLLPAGPTRDDTTDAPDAPAATRAALVDAFAQPDGTPGAILPPPSGSGVLFNAGVSGPPTDAVRMGPGSGRPLALAEVPWQQWLPNARLWGLAALMLGLASLCLALIVHPQWSRHELLPYPIARFVSEMTRREDGRALPTVARSGMFWVAAGFVFAWHLVNGLHEWIPAVPEIPRTLEFNALRILFPDASQVADIRAYLRPSFYFTVVALAFFLNRSVSFSIGIAPLCYVVLATIMIKRGEVLQGEYLGAGQANMLRFGAWLAMGGLVLYVGRRYYLAVAAATVGLPRAELGPASVWAARGLIVAAAAAVVVLTTGGLSVPFAVALVFLILLMFLVLARIVAETGMFFIQPYWMPIGVLTGLFGFEMIGPTTYIVAALASTMLVGDVRSALMGNLVNGLKIVESTGNRRPVRLTPWLLIMIVAGFLVAGAATLWTAYNHGFGGTDNFTRTGLPNMPFDQLARHVSDAATLGLLAPATDHGGTFDLSLVSFSGELYAWTAAGIVLLLLTTVARLRLPWWPLHPIVFLIWGTFPATQFAFSFLIGWAAKSTVMSVGGAAAYRLTLPIMIGLVAGDFAAAFFWILVGTAYYLATGQPPPATASSKTTPHLKTLQSNHLPPPVASS